MKIEGERILIARFAEKPFGKAARVVVAFDPAYVDVRNIEIPANRIERPQYISAGSAADGKDAEGISAIECCPDDIVMEKVIEDAEALGVAPRKIGSCIDERIEVGGFKIAVEAT